MRMSDAEIDLFASALQHSSVYLNMGLEEAPNLPLVYRHSRASHRWSPIQYFSTRTLFAPILMFSAQFHQGG